MLQGKASQRSCLRTFRLKFFPCVYSRQLETNKGALWINTTVELMAPSA